MKICNPEKFNKIVKTLANFCKLKRTDGNKRPFHEIIYYSENKLYSTEGHVMAMIDISDCTSIINYEPDFVFPSNTITKKNIGLDAENKLIVDNKKVDCEQFETKFYKKILPKQKPKAELTLDFSSYGNLNIGFHKALAYVKISNNKVILDYQDEVDTICTIEDCFSSSSNLLDDDYGDFQTVKFLMEQFFWIMKISKKFKIQQWEIDGMHKIIAGDYEFLIMPFKR